MQCHNWKAINKQSLLNLLNDQESGEKSSPVVEHIERLLVSDRLDAFVLGVIQRSDLFELAVLCNDTDHCDQKAEYGLQHDVQRQEAIEVLAHETYQAAMLSRGKSSMEEGEETSDNESAGHGMGNHGSSR